MPRLQTLIAVILVVCVLSQIAVAQTDVGYLGIYADESGSSCQIQDVDGIVVAYIIHMGTTGITEANTSQFRLVQDSDVQMSLIAATVNPELLSIGDVETGISITYVGCQYDFPLVLMKLTFVGTGTTSECSPLRLAGDPRATSGDVEIVSCEPLLRHIAEVSEGRVNNTGDCSCVKEVLTVLDTDPPGLTVTIDGVNYTAPETVGYTGGETYEIGVPVLQGTPDTQYAFSSWSDGGAATHTIVTPDVDTTITATFYRGARFTIDTDPPGLDIVSDGIVYTAPRDLYWVEGTEHQVSVRTPQYVGPMRYEFADWSDGGELTHDVTAPGVDTTLTATFVPRPRFRIWVWDSPAMYEVDGVLLGSSHDFYWEPGTVHTVSTWTPQGNFHFVSWSDGGAMSHSVVAPSTNTTLLLTFDRFLGPGLTIETDPKGFSFLVDGDLRRTSTTYYWDTSSIHTVSAFAYQRSDTLYRFSRWSDGGAREHEINMPGFVDTLTAYYVPTFDPAYAEGLIGVYLTGEASNCNIIDSPGTVTFEVVHTGTMSADESRFRIEESPGFGMTFVSSKLLTGTATGDVHTGITISYGECVPPARFPLRLMELTYQATGDSEPCSYIEVVADPFSGSGEIEVVDCSAQTLLGLGGKLTFNGTQECICVPPVEVERSTWGRVKARYRSQ